MYSGTLINVIFLIAVTVIWFMIGYQALLFFKGYRYYYRTRRNGRSLPALSDVDLPGVSVLVPCHNEELVIADTIKALCALNYPTELLQILIVDDGSTDRTAEIVSQAALDSHLTLLQVPPTLAAQGKSGALNYGLEYAMHSIVAIYDADNQPEPDALRPLVEALVQDSRLGAAIGVYRCINRRRNLLTRFLNIEGIGFQWIVQAGRRELMGFTALPGTNYVIWRSLLESLGGWDQSALSEDAELTLRIYESGYSITFVPASVSWEQEPETLLTWMRQRHRWVRGNNHVFRKHLRSLLRIRPRLIGMEVLYSLSLYYAFFLTVAVSDLLLVGSLAGLLRIDVPGPYTLVWLLALLAFFFELATALAYEDEGKGLTDHLLILAMYFTYCQLWLPVVAWAFYDDFVSRRPVKWAKTRRFRVPFPTSLAREETPCEVVLDTAKETVSAIRMRSLASHDQVNQSGSNGMSKVLIVFGTRPEAIKLCPVIQHLREAQPGLSVKTCVTAQHRHLLDQVLRVFQVEPEYDLNCMKPGQSLFQSTSRILSALEDVLLDDKPDLVLVQGDTTSTLCGALAGFYAGVPVGHIEAGLRTGDIHEPFPEEGNRVVASKISTLHFAATEWAAENLQKEGVSPANITITGNTGIDAVLQIRNRLLRGLRPDLPLSTNPSLKLILVTAHRRESFGDGFEQICAALTELARRRDVQIVYPVHPNPNVREPVDRHLKGRSRIALIEPMEYVPFVAMLMQSTIILTDSGGIQEEAPSLGKPVLVMRDKTERPEAVAAGTARLVGREKERIVAECNRLLDDDEAYEFMARAHNPYGDGHASERIVKTIREFLGHGCSQASAH